jgi:hypothetical protein
MCWVGLVLAVAGGAFVRPALAAEADKAAARAHFEAATRLYEVHDYAKALEEYKAAYLAKPDPAFLFNMGQCYKKLGKPAQALEFYRDYLRKTPPGDPNRANIEARVRELEAGDVFEGDKTAAPPAKAAPVAPAPSPMAPAPAPTYQTYPPPSAPVYYPPPPAAPAPAVAPTPAAASPAGVDLTATTQPQQDSSATPFYGTWWFWTGVGAVVVAGTVTAILLASGGSNTLTADTALGTRGAFQ